MEMRQEKQSKKRLSQEQVRVLERSFTTHKKLEPELKQKLAKQLGVPPRQVAIWYQNKRARWRTQSLEVEYSTVQVKLEHALADKRRLERDVKQLREELRQTQHMLMFNNNSSNSSSGFENNCSSDYGGDEVMQQFDELYACLIGAGVGNDSNWG